MTEYLYFQSLVQYRVPLLPGGSIGQPEVTKKFTVPIKEAKKFNASKKVVKPVSAEVGEVEYF